MADNPQLDAFLAEGAPQEPAQAPEAQTPPESPAKPEAAPTASTAPAKATEKAAKPEEPDDDADPPSPQLGEAVVPRRALEDERHKRRDWKEKASRYEGENTELRKQLEEAKRTPAPQAAQPQQQVYQQPIPNPATDPVGYAQYVAVKQAQDQLNHQLNTSELFLRDKLGDEKVDEYVNEFKQHAERDPTLFGKLYQQPHPYGWMMREVDRLRLQRDIGDDPAKFRERLIAEERAKWEAEAAQRGPAVPQAAPVPGMQPSLANARSVAGRTAAAWTGEPSLEDVLAPVQNRKRANGQSRGF